MTIKTLEKKDIQYEIIKKELIVLKENQKLIARGVFNNKGILRKGTILLKTEKKEIILKQGDFNAKGYLTSGNAFTYFSNPELKKVSIMEEKGSFDDDGYLVSGIVKLNDKIIKSGSFKRGCLEKGYLERDEKIEKISGVVTIREEGVFERINNTERLKKGKILINKNVLAEGTFEDGNIKNGTMFYHRGTVIDKYVGEWELDVNGVSFLKKGQLYNIYQGTEYLVVDGTLNPNTTPVQGTYNIYNEMFEIMFTYIGDFEYSNGRLRLKKGIGKNKDGETIVTHNDPLNPRKIQDLAFQ